MDKREGCERELVMRNIKPQRKSAKEGKLASNWERSHRMIKDVSKRAYKIAELTR